MRYAQTLTIAALMAAGISNLVAVTPASADQKRCYFAAFNGDTPKTSKFLIWEGGSHKKKQDKACKEAKKRCEKALKKAKKNGIPRGTRTPTCLRVG